jgi:hypothetical protein
MESSSCDIRKSKAALSHWFGKFSDVELERTFLVPQILIAGCQTSQELV